RRHEHRTRTSHPRLRRLHRKGPCTCRLAGSGGGRSVADLHAARALVRHQSSVDLRHLPGQLRHLAREPPRLFQDPGRRPWSLLHRWCRRGVRRGARWWWTPVSARPPPRRDPAPAVCGVPPAARLAAGHHDQLSGRATRGPRRVRGTDVALRRHRDNTHMRPMIELIDVETQLFEVLLEEPDNEAMNEAANALGVWHDNEITLGSEDETGALLDYYLFELRDGEGQSRIDLAAATPPEGLVD